MNPKHSPYPLEPKASYFCAAVKTDSSCSSSKSCCVTLKQNPGATPVPAQKPLTLAITAKNLGTTMRCCTASAFQSVPSVSPDNLRQKGCACAFHFLPVWGQQAGDQQDLGLSGYQNIFRAMCLNTFLLIISNTFHTEAVEGVITYRI